ncbi:helix-turn-helix domain-containing protein [Paenibacillus antri]|uniref:Helix-turn-helix domain-containing protein n=1 Tax=Paenibacillus antri TaxID=2582848 RepID=A0A5R9G7I1_9BACL|nr:AraC family transcriptional regulator [Paenibacillus antri]TLS52372.1 helix-turn-helix domain-containing protein [Paenibacillus antri]
MTVLQFLAPPLPHFTIGGEDRYPAGRKHHSRSKIGVFDLLFVTQGALYMAEEDREYDVMPGKALILRPDLQHHAYKPCTADTHFYWLHFQTIGGWRELSDETPTDYRPPDDPYLPIASFMIDLPRFCSLANPARMQANFARLLEMQTAASAPWEQQILFQEIVRELNSRQMEMWNSPVYRAAEQTALYLRQHYRAPITNAALKERLHFHPTYLARCMKQVYGCTPLAYANGLRLRQAKTLLMRTDMPVHRIAADVGFNSSTYFIRCFVQAEGMTPKSYRSLHR